MTAMTIIKKNIKRTSVMKEKISSSSDKENNSETSAGNQISHIIKYDMYYNIIKFDLCLENKEHFCYLSNNK